MLSSDFFLSFLLEQVMSYILFCFHASDCRDPEVAVVERRRLTRAHESFNRPKFTFRCIDRIHTSFATMGKKAKSTAKIQKAADRKIDKSTLPPPPPPPEEEVRIFYVSMDR